MAHVGVAVSGLFQSWSGQWTKGAGTEYDTFTGTRTTQLQGAHVKHYKASELAKVKANSGPRPPARRARSPRTASCPTTTA